MSIAARKNLTCSFVFLTLVIGWPLTADLYQLPRAILFLLGSSYLFYTHLKALPGYGPARYAGIFAAFVVWQFLSCGWAINPAEGLLMATLNLSCLFLFVVCCVNKDILQLAAKTVSAAVLVYILAGLCQLVQITGFSYEELAAVTGLNANKNFFSGILFIALPLQLLALADKPGGRQKWLLAFNCLATLLFFVMLQTRAVWLGAATMALALSGLYIMKLRSKPVPVKMIITATLVLAAVILFIILNKNAQRSFTERVSVQNALKGESSVERLKVWQNSIQLIKESPLMGVGEGNWQYNFLKYGVRDIPSVQERFTVFQSPHNDYLWVASETGIPGLLLFLTLLFWPAAVCLRIIFANNVGELKIKAAICFAFLLGYLVYSFFDFPRYRVEHNFMLTVLLAFIFSLEHRVPGKKMMTVSWIRIVFWPVLIFICLFFCYRAKGEYYAKQMLAARAKKQNDQVIRLSQKAESAFYTSDPTGIPLQWYSAHAYNSLQQPGLAYNSFLEALPHSPYNFYMLGDLAAAELLKQQYPRAEAHLLEAVRINDKYTEGYFNLATLYFYQNNFKKALFYAEKTPPSEKHNFFINTITAKQKEAGGI